MRAGQALDNLLTISGKARELGESLDDSIDSLADEIKRRADTSNLSAHLAENISRAKEILDTLENIANEL